MEFFTPQLKKGMDSMSQTWLIERVSNIRGQRNIVSTYWLVPPDNWIFLALTYVVMQMLLIGFFFVLVMSEFRDEEHDLLGITTSTYLLHQLQFKNFMFSISLADIV